MILAVYTPFSKKLVLYANENGANINDEIDLASYFFAIVLKILDNMFM